MREVVAHPMSTEKKERARIILGMEKAYALSIRKTTLSGLNATALQSCDAVFKAWMCHEKSS